MSAGPAELQRFESHFGRKARFCARAPGRVNLIGEHTDYNQGLVLPCAIDRETRVVAAPRDDSRVRVLASDLGEEAEFDSTAPTRRGSWVDYVQAVVFAFAERGHRVPGLDLMITSDVPREAGLSSSAALGVAVATVVDAAADFGLDSRELARIVHRGESEFVGVGCGILDQFASALCQRGHALRIDCRDETCTPVPLPSQSLRLLLTDSGVRRALSAEGSGYLARVAECEAALAAARDAGLAAPAATSLRDLSLDRLESLEVALDPVLFRRVRHVLTENRRVEDFCDALRAPSLDPARLGSLLSEAQRSLRDDYEVSVPELDLLCEIGCALPGVHGARLTGAGFGGWVLHLVDADAAEEAGSRICRSFEARTGRKSAFTLVAPSQGASRVEL